MLFIRRVGPQPRRRAVCESLLSHLLYFRFLWCLNFISIYLMKLFLYEGITQLRRNANMIITRYEGREPYGILFFICNIWATCREYWIYVKCLKQIEFLSLRWCNREIKYLLDLYICMFLCTYVNSASISMMNLKLNMQLIEFRY